MKDNTKYPRTYHVPFSPGATSDDKMLTEKQFNDYFIGEQLIITEKMDGENTAFTCEDCYARSHGAPTRSPWSRNLWDNDGLLWRLKDKIGANEIVYGENLYAIHSIEYNHLKDYFLMFAARDDKEWYSWSDVELMAQSLDIKTVPVLWKGRLESIEQLKTFITNFMNEPSTYGKEKEGVVIRVASSFPIEDFSKNVCKYVRANHVQTDVHWTKTWKKAEIEY